MTDSLVLPNLRDELRAAAVAAQSFVATAKGAAARLNLTTFAEPLRGASIQHIEGETWDAIAHADAALAANPVGWPEITVSCRASKRSPRPSCSWMV